MWTFVLFDLPTETKKQRKAYSNFRKAMLKDGFEMLQYSIYYRHAASREYMETHIKKIENQMPNEGKVSIMMVTDKQFGDIKHYWCASQIDPPDTPSQLVMF